ncbi:MAG: YraN family protein [Chlorobiaceae bacterium]|nr:YraN family protein [Chlorobiaceae bacterium]
MHAPHWLGTEGEKLAARHLAGKGYRIVARNFRFHRNEIDIIAHDGKVLCFIEVKTRASLDKGHPAEAVTLRKQQEIARAASGYLAGQKNPWIDCRFDVVTILAKHMDESSILDYDLEHFKGAFMTGEGC